MADSIDRFVEVARRLIPQGLKRRLGDWARDHPLAYRWKVRILARRCDVFLVSFPKSGRTWLRMMLGHALQTRFGFPERRLMFATKAGIDRPGMPRILATHDDDPQVKRAQRVFSDKRAYRDRKVIFLIRDPRDLLVSYYFHRSKRTTGDFRFEGDLDDFLSVDAGIVESLVAFYNAWARQREVPNGFLLVRYEDMHADPAGQLRRVLDFIGAEGVDDGAIARAVNLSSFDRMQEIERTGSRRGRSLRPGDPADPDSFKVREGRVGGHRDALTEAQRADLDRRLLALDPFYASYR